jgi:2,3-diketo-5-methylthio-1-phosphopentane phosphatase
LAPLQRWQILCDFDGTIALDDVVDAMFMRYAVPNWREIDPALGQDECYSADYVSRCAALLRLSQAEWDAYLDAVKIDPGFPAFVAEADRLGLPLTVASNGYDYSVKYVLARHGFGHLEVISNHLTFAADRRISMTFPNAHADCAVEAATCKCAAMGRLRNRKAVLVGDGISDYCVAGAADFVFAKDSLIRHCRAEGIPHLSFRGFDELIPHMALIAGDGSELLALNELAAA